MLNDSSTLVGAEGSIKSGLDGPSIAIELRHNAMAELSGAEIISTSFQIATGVNLIGASHVYLSAGKISAGGGHDGWGVAVREQASFEFANGEISLPGSDSSVGIRALDDSRVRIIGGAVTIGELNATDAHAIEAANNGRVVVSDGTFWTHPNGGVVRL